MNFVVKNFDELTKEELYKILKIRSQIFIVEQGMRCQDMDNVDFNARHYYLKQGGEIVAYLRAFYTNDTTVRIGRVLSATHGIGLGTKIMAKAIADIKQNMKCQKICLDSQTHAIAFYEKLGFKTVSDEFLEEGVMHVKMELTI